MLQDPYVIADFFGGLDSHHDPIHAAVVRTASTGRTQKGSELVISVDRRTVCIYNVLSSRLETSYAIPPYAKSQCPPASIRCRAHNGAPASRYTYCAFKDHHLQIRCFQEMLADNELNSTIETHSKTSDVPSPIVRLEIIPDVSDGEADFFKHNLLIVYESGRLDCYSTNLQELLWSVDLGRDATSLVQDPTFEHVLYAKSISVSQARQTLLKGREDLLMTFFDGIESATEETLLFVVSTHPQDASSSDVHISLWRMPRSAHADAKYTSRQSDQLFSHTLSLLSSSEKSVSEISLRLESGTLYVNNGSDLDIVDLTQPVPQMSSIMPTGPTISSHLPISSTLIATAMDTKVTMIEITYNSVQAELDLSRKTKTGVSQPTNGIDGMKKNDLRLISYFPHNKIITIIHNGKLLGLPLQNVPPQGTRKRTKDGLLINSLGRGTTSSDFNSDSSASRIDTYILQELTSTLLNHGHQAWEEKMLSDLNISLTENPNINYDHIQYLVSQIFDATASDRVDSTGQLVDVTLRCWPSKLGPWLARQGLLTTDQVTSSLISARAIPRGLKVRPGSIIRAVGTHDSTLGILHEILAGRTILEPLDLAEALRFYQYHSLSTKGNVKRLTTGNDNYNSTHEQQVASTLFEDNITSQVLYLTLTRLDAYPTAPIATALREVCTSAQLRSLLNLLRLEIAQHGWLTPYIDPDHQTEPPSSSNINTQAKVVLHTINSILDALGPTNWLGLESHHTSSSTELVETADTLLYMQAETSAALEGVEEATYLKGLLGEILMYGRDSLKQRAQDKIQPKTQKRVDESDSMLPLGLNSATAAVPRTRVADGGEIIRRKPRDIGRLKSRRVQKYSFERIVF